MEYTGKTIIAWLTYNENYIGEENKVLYIFPRYVKWFRDTRNVFEKMPEDATNDRIDIYLPPRKDAKEEYANYGPLIEIKFIEEPKLSSKSSMVDRNYFTIWFNMVELEKVHDLIQVIEIQGSFRDLNPDQPIAYPVSSLFSNELIIGTHDYNYYGPFDLKQEEEKLFLLGKRQYHYFVKKYSIFEIDKLCMPVSDDKGKVQAVFLQKHDLPAQDIQNHQDRIDWMDNRLLADKFKAILKTVDDPQKYTKREIKQISAVISNTLDLSTDIELTKERKERLLGALDLVIQQEDFFEDIISYIVNNQEILDTLIMFLREDDFKRIEEKNNAFSVIRERLATLQSEKSHNEKAVKKIREEIQQLTTMKQQLPQIIAESLKEFSNQEKNMIRLIDHKWLHEILRDSEQEPRTETVTQGIVDDETDAVFDIQLLVKSDTLSGNAIIERVRDYIRSNNRDISRNDVVNYITCIMQGFITTFAGEPGTGKTSLCTILAKSLGLARSDTNTRFIDISVERGWTSHKDFIGYYNPLTKRMEKSNNEVFDAFSRLNQECTAPVDAPFFILLDEANLSPIEHYWATFLKLCDPDSPHSRSLALGGNHYWKIPEHLRFLATVNFDHTTEELSPRFLDRSWIITLNPNLINSKPSVDHEAGNLESIVPFSALSAAFLSYTENNESLASRCNEKWESIQRIFQKHNLPVMPRNQKMVRSYYTVACRYMEWWDETRFTPLDYAISQKILPVINGTGRQYQTLLKDLQEACKSMPLCDYHIGRIIQAAEENMGFYQFFAK
jgi:hypothetical protein